MKTIILFLVFVTATFISSAQDKNLVGTWNITECAYITDSGTEKVMDEQIKSGAAVTDYIFGEDGKYKLTSNMSGSGTIDTFEGAWKTSDNELIMTLNVNNQIMDILWKYELKDNLLVLSRTNPDGTVTIANTFKKK